MRHSLLALILVIATSAFASTASASDLIDRNAHGVSLAVNKQGRGADHVRARPARRGTFSRGAR